jgi:hypothetical protein
LSEFVLTKKKLKGLSKFSQTPFSFHYLGECAQVNFPNSEKKNPHQILQINLVPSCSRPPSFKRTLVVPAPSIGLPQRNVLLSIYCLVEFHWWSGVLTNERPTIPCT